MRLELHGISCFFVLFGASTLKQNTVTEIYRKTHELEKCKNSFDSPPHLCSLLFRPTSVET